MPESLADLSCRAFSEQLFSKAPVPVLIIQHAPDQVFILDDPGFPTLSVTSRRCELGQFHSLNDLININRILAKMSYAVTFPKKLFKTKLLNIFC